MELKIGEITSVLENEIGQYTKEIDIEETGTVILSGDGIARVHGLKKAQAGELVELPHDVKGVVLNLEEDNVGVALFGEVEKIGEGGMGEVYRSSSFCSTKAGSQFFEYNRT